MKPSDIAKSILLLMLAYICFAVLNIVSKKLYAAKIDPFIITFYRSFFCLLITFPFAFIRIKNNKRFKFARINVYKGIIDFLSIPAWVMAVSHMNIPDAVGLSYLTPLLTALMAIIFLKDSFTVDKWLIMIIGLTGAYIILRPDVINFNSYSWFAIIACVLWASGNILTKNLTNIQHPSVIVFFTNIVIFMLATPFFAMNPTFLKTDTLILSFIMSLMAAGGYFFMAHACRLTKLSNLIPYDYFRLIFATIFAYIILGQTIELNTIVGAALIFVSSLYLTHKQLKEKSMK